MYEIGLNIFIKLFFLFRLVELRVESMNLLVVEYNRLRGVLEFFNVYLYNEIIEVGLLKGLMGIFFIFFFYFLLFYIVYKKRVLGLLILTFGIVGIGFSDVIIWVRSILIIIIFVIVFLFVINNRNNIIN